ncbi:MAG: metallophosphoesterase family protein [Endomicrobiaceae bacterium]|nr:metallophosphoesterase family protein [Endomicrobiaceae bacterium]
MSDERMIAIGDIHGCIHTLKALLKEADYKSATDTLVFVGDYIDRGYYSFETVDFLIKLQRQVGKDKVVCLKGNHELMATGFDFDLWMYNGGHYTIASYERNGQDVSIHKSWMRNLPLIYDTPEIIFCHAGLSKSKIEDNTEEDLLWGREWLSKNIPTPDNKQVIFGHTPMEEVFQTANGSIGIDTGCVFGNKLTGIIFTDEGSKIISVKKAVEDCDIE